MEVTRSLIKDRIRRPCGAQCSAATRSRQRHCRGRASTAIKTSGGGRSTSPRASPTRTRARVPRSHPSGSGGSLHGGQSRGLVANPAANRGISGDLRGPPHCPLRGEPLVARGRRGFQSLSLSSIGATARHAKRLVSSRAFFTAIDCKQRAPITRRVPSQPLTTGEHFDPRSSSRSWECVEPA